MSYFVLGFSFLYYYFFFSFLPASWMVTKREDILLLLFLFLFPDLGNFCLFKHLLELNWAVKTMDVSFTSGTVLSMTFLTTGMGVFISAFHTAFSVSPWPESPNPLFRIGTLTEIFRQSPSPAHIWHPDLSLQRHVIYFSSLIESHEFPFTLNKGNFHRFIFS